MAHKHRAGSGDNINNASTTRNYYSNYVDTFTTVNSLTTTAFSRKMFDGAGRVYLTGGDNPTSTGLFRAQHLVFDIMGRLAQTSNPAETNSGWSPTGDDTGWVYTTQTYDWKGRPLVTTNTDGTTRSVSYTGCGCAGGQVATITDEVGRKQKVTQDILGRAAKSEMLNADGSTYSTTSDTYDLLDHVAVSRQFQGSDQSSTYQDTVMFYDGHGRLSSRKAPEQSSAISYAYNADDTTNVVTDARGATSTLGYNGRHLVTSINYWAPAGITPTVTVSFGYDAAGNRTSMTDGTGNTSYAFDQLSRLASETRTFTGLSGSYPISYGYNPAGELTSITDPFGAQVGYNHDFVGRLTGVTGTGYLNVSTYASNIQWRAWGAMKHLTYGNGRGLDASYNSRMEATDFSVTGVMSSHYQYDSGGRISYAKDLMQSNSPFDRGYSYDQVGRLIEGKTGTQARGGGLDDGPYHETYGFNVWGKLTDRTGTNWGQAINGFSATYTNNRRVDWQYDANGMPTQQDTLQTTYDAAGHRIRTVDSAPRGRFNAGLTINQDYDGNGARVKQQQNTAAPKFFLRSSVLGGVLNELVSVNGTTQKTKGYVYAAGQLLATQETSEARWVHFDPLTENEWQSNATTAWGVAQVDPLGVNVGFSPPPDTSGPPSTESDLLLPSKYGDILNGSTGCTIDGAMASCDEIQSMNPDSYTKLPPGVSTIQIIINRDTGGLGIRGTDLVIDPNTGGVKKWIKDTGTKLPDGPDGTAPDGTPITRKTGNDDSLGHWEYILGSAAPQDTGRRLIGGDRLSPCLKNALASYFPGLDLNNISIHGYIPLAPKYFSGPDAYTFKNDVYFKNYNPGSEKGFTDLTHELTHVDQFYQLTTLGFLSLYGAEYRYNRVQGMSPFDAYSNISLELDASANAAKIVADLKKKNNGKLPCSD